MTDINEKMAEFMGWKQGLNHYYDQNNQFVLVDIKNWQPTEDLNQAMMVVEKVYEKKGYPLELYSADPNIGVKGWIAQFIKENNHAFYSEEADTPALAICRAVEQVMEG